MKNSISKAEIKVSDDITIKVDASDPAQLIYFLNELSLVYGLVANTFRNTGSFINAEDYQKRSELFYKCCSELGAYSDWE